MATASLELGIDIGNVDLVCQINSPRAISVALQRIGRAGHWRGAIPKGRLFATTRDDLVECAAAVYAIRSGDLDRLAVPEKPLDILAQQIVAMCSCEDWDETELFECVRRAYPYRDLTAAEFEKILEMLSQGIAASRGRYGAYLHRDMVNRKLKARRGARLAAITSGGAIPETALYSVVVQPEEIAIGTVDEDFAVESNAGDIILLGNTSWRVTRVESKSGRVVVEDAHGAPPTIPFWLGEAPARTAELSQYVAKLREQVSAMLPNTAPLRQGLKPEDFKASYGTAEAVPFQSASLPTQTIARLENCVVPEGLESFPRSTQHSAFGSVLGSLMPAPEGLVQNAVALKPAGNEKNEAAARWPEGQLYPAGLEASSTQNRQQLELAGNDKNNGPDAGPSTTLRAGSEGQLYPESSPEVQKAVAWLKTECGLDDSGAEQLIEYVVAGRAVLGAVPTQTTIIAERFFDEGGGMQLILHAPFGGRINKAWGLALRKRFCRSFNFELQAAATDNGINIALAEQHSFPLSDVFHYLQVETLQEILEQAALASPIFGTRFRWDANRALALLRFQGGKKVPPYIQRIRSEDLMAAVFPDVAACLENIEGDIKIPDHPLVEEVMKDVLTEAMDIDGLRQVLAAIWDGSIRCIAVDTPVPSQFSHEILNANPYAFLDDAPLEERRARAVQMRRVLPEAVLNEVGRLDQAAIARVREEARPDVRDADELHDALQTLVALPEEIPDPEWKAAVEDWMRFLPELLETWRVLRVSAGDRRYIVASERATEFALIYPDAKFEATPPELSSSASSRDDSLLLMIKGWMMHSGPTSVAALGFLLGLPTADIAQALLRLEASGSALRGNFTGHAKGGEPETAEWCDRRLLARIHHLTVATLRKQVEPVTAAQYMRWLLRWQHVTPDSQLRGERGLLEAIRQLQGFEIPAIAWEKQILRPRVNEYDPAVLDQLCLTGAVGWGRLSPHPATLDESSSGRRRVVPTSVAPITFFVREDSDWMQPHNPEDTENEDRVLSESGRLVTDFLRKRGASFFADIVRGTAKLKAEIETALWELVAAGLVTADGFDNLRSLISPARRATPGSPKIAKPRHAAGRWSLLYTVEAAERNKTLEAMCRMLLRRYGVVFREVLARESNLPKWRELLIMFRRLEDRGEVRGGRFVSGFLGEQFALPEAVESLRAMRNLPSTGEVLVVSAADPLNLVGFIVPGERVPAISGRYVKFRDGVAVDPEERSALLREAGAQ